MSPPSRLVQQHCCQQTVTIQQKQRLRGKATRVSDKRINEVFNKEMNIFPPSRLVQAATLPTDRDDTTEARAQASGDPNFL